MTDPSGRPDGSPHLAPGSSFEVPVVTAALSRRELRERQDATSVAPVETRRQRRERELSQATATPAVVSELAVAAEAAPVEPAPAAANPALTEPAPVPVPVPAESLPTRRARRDIRGLEHLLLAPTEPAAPPAADETSPAAPASTAATAAPEAAPVASRAPAPALTAPAPAVTVTATAGAATAGPASILFDTVVRPGDADTASLRTITVARDDAQPEQPARARVAAPRGARTSISAADRDGRGPVSPRLRRTGGTPRPESRKRTIVNSVVMVATAGLVATLALPAYAYSDTNGDGPSVRASSSLGIQSLTVQGVNGQTSARDDYSTTGNVAAMDSTNGTTVSPTVQALAAELMADVASGKLVGSVPDHIVEIRNLANGVAVPGCGVDYRVLQTIKVAVDNFDKVGVSDINRHCTGQIEGAGTASSHYKDGGGHAVDFYILNGHGLNGADSDSLKLIGLLDPLVPKGSGLGQSECRSSIPVTNFAPFPDTCTHMHVDFGAAQGVALKSQ